jgi:polar amino acid transport system substrate-binding protein
MAWSRRSVLGAGGLTILATLGGCAGRDDGVLKIGATATGAPFSFAGEDGRTLVGAMVDIGQAVATSAGYSAVVETTPFAALIPSLMTRKIDVIAAAMLRTPEREEVVAFSDPVYEYGGGLVVRADDAARYAALAELRDKRVAVQIGTRFVDQLTEAQVTGAKTYDTLADCMRDLANGRVDVVYGDAPILKHQVAANAVPGLRVVDGFTPPAMEQVCLVLRKDEPEMLTRLNTAIATLTATEIAQIVGKWGL